MHSHLARLALLVTAALAACHPVTKRQTLTLTSELGAPDGQSRYLVKVNGQYPGPALVFDEDDNVEITVINKMKENTTIHWHGMLQDNSQWSDGVPGLTQAPIEPGQSFIYRFKASPAGTYWYHAHVRAQLMDGLYGTLFIRRKQGSPTPWHFISQDPHDIAQMDAAAKDPRFMLISDWSKYTATEYLYYQNYAQTNIFCMDSYLINGKGKVNCPGHEGILQNMSPIAAFIFGDDQPTDKGCFPIDTLTQFQFYNNTHPERIPRDMYFDCIPADGGQEIVEVDPKKSPWVSLNFIGTITLSEVYISIDEHPMWVYEVDGNYIEPRLVHALEIDPGERFSVMVKLDKTPKDYVIRVPNNGATQVIWGQATLKYTNQGHQPHQNESTPYISWCGINTTSDVVYLDKYNMPPYPALPPGQHSDALHVFNITRNGGAWKFSMTGSDQQFPMDWHANTPFLQTGVDQADAHNAAFAVRSNYNQWVDLVVQWNSAPDETTHTVHKHGTKFWIIGTHMGEFKWKTTAEAMAEVPEAFNLKTPAYRDTATNGPSDTDFSWMMIRYQASNPGAWLFHCHIDTHLAEGFAVMLLDGVDKWPKVPAEYGIGRNGHR